MRKYIGIVALTMAFGFAAGQSVVVQGTTMPGASSPYDNAYNRASQVNLTGTVVGIGQSKPSKIMPTNTRLIVQTLGHKTSTYLVELGPQWYVGKQHTKPKIGQWVKVTGSRISDHGQTKILAMTVELHNRHVLALRRPNGDPYWANMAAPTQTLTAQKDTPAPGTVLSTTTFNVNGVEYPGYVVQTTNGPQNIVVMPENFQSYYPPIQSYSLGGGLRVIGAGFYPVVTVGGPFGASPFVVPSMYNPAFPQPSGVLSSGQPLHY